jgi:PPK2 family polyphosphate:nucleotide phosphotransferase
MMHDHQKARWLMEAPVAKGKHKGTSQESMSALLGAPTGPVELKAIDTSATPGFSGSKGDAAAAVATLATETSDLQERLFAEGRTGGHRRLLLVVQGMDTSGKGGTMRHVVGHMDPQGLTIRAFKAPTAEEKRHDFLWRIKRALAQPGYVGVFDRSHYEDVLVVRVRRLASATTIARRYDAINRFEERLVDDGCTIIKVMLHISPEEQKDRLLARLDDPTKHWKYHPGDVDERALWDDYQEAYAIAIERTNTAHAPWFIVPADRKWYRNWAISNLLLEHLRGLNLQWPVAQFDVAAERERVLAA